MRSLGTEASTGLRAGGAELPLPKTRRAVFSLFLEE